MRLIRGHDYYDSAAGYAGYEKDDPAILVREHKRYYRTYKDDTIPKDFPFKFPIIHIGWANGSMQYSEDKIAQGYFYDNLSGIYPIVVFFAGKLYRGLIDLPANLAENQTKYAYDNATPFTSIWGMNELENFIEKKKKEVGKNSYYTYRKGNIHHVTDLSKFAGYFSPVELTPNERAWAIDNNLAIFMYYKSTSTVELIINPVNLKACSFYKVLNPFEAYQELSMWVGGVLCGRENPMATISNDDKIAKHGFDDKSFRKEPWKKRKTK